MNTELYSKYEKYSQYYDLCAEAREIFREAAENICKNENLYTEAIRIKNKIADKDENIDTTQEFAGKSPQFAGFVYTIAIEDMEDIYQKKNISREIFFDNIRDLPIWINYYHKRHSEWGISEGWFIKSLRGIVIRLGRLQFEQGEVYEAQIYKNKSGELIAVKNDDIATDRNDSELVLKTGEPMLNVHIPEDGKLFEADCLNSFETAKKFYKETFNYEFKAFSCFTWLFDPVFKDLLPYESNVIKFQNLFIRFPHVGETDEALRRVFVNITRENIKDAPHDTYFRKTLAEYIENGGKLQSGGGYRLV